MKKIAIILLAAAMAFPAAGQQMQVSAPLADAAAAADTTSAKKKKNKKPVQYNEKGEIIKTGLNVGPFPIIAFDADKGLQLGALINLYDFGDGSTYPNPRQKWYAEGSYYFKGSMLFKLTYENYFSIPNVRVSASAIYARDKAYDFFGFGGYQANYDWERMAVKADPEDPSKYSFSPFYKHHRDQLLLSCDFVGNIWNKKLFWEAGLHFNYFNITAIDRASINKGKKEYDMFPSYDPTQPVDPLFNQPTLWENFRDWGVIPEDELYGGFNTEIRLGILYDTRNKRAAPSKGIWAEGHAILAFPGISKNSYYRYSLTFRHYVTLVKDDWFTFAYRINYIGSFGSKVPYYMLPYMTMVGESFDYEAFGGYRTVRGIMRSRVEALDALTWNVEFRSRFVKFKVARQNIALGLSAFCDGTWATRNYDMTPGKGGKVLTIAQQEAYIKYMDSAPLKGKDLPHASIGAGFRFIMNENFILAVEYGMPISNMVPKTNPIYKQDGNGAFYVNVGYLF
ncbi:MAG: BamA/TamA family outer membrane protein [Bacteroidales bacterium]|nr:BamA/TamA family outer membrane protein [Bacteroidales bacterium]